MENEEMILPDDFVETPPEVDSQAEQQIETNVEDTKPTEVQQELPKIRVKFNHEERELGIDEAIPYVQKGMNYDKLQEKYQALENDPRLTFVEKLARENRMSVPEYLEAVEAQRERDEIQSLAQAEGMSEEMAERLYKLEKKDREREEKAQQEQEARAKREKEDAELLEFIDAYKDVDIDKVPNEVWIKNKQGVPLKYAYMEHEVSEMRNQIKILKQNQENTKKAPVGGVTLHGSTDIGEDDPFLQGFNSY